MRAEIRRRPNSRRVSKSITCACTNRDGPECTRLGLMTPCQACGLAVTYGRRRIVMLYPPRKEAAADPTEQLPLEERIQKRAYELYVLRGNESGSEMDDWLQAEDEIRAVEERSEEHTSELQSLRHLV